MKFQTTPVTVEAYLIIQVSAPDYTRNQPIVLASGEMLTVPAEMCAVRLAEPGDFWVVPVGTRGHLVARDEFVRTHEPILGEAVYAAAQQPEPAAWGAPMEQGQAAAAEAPMEQAQADAG